MSDEPSDSKKKKYDADEVVDRMIAEQARTGNLLKEIQKVVNSTKEFEGMTILGGIKSILRRYREEQETVRKLNKELDDMLKQQIKANRGR